MVDWSLARQVARLAAGSGVEPGEDPDVVALCAEMEGHVAAYTGSSSPRPCRRRSWSSATSGRR